VDVNEFEVIAFCLVDADLYRPTTRHCRPCLPSCQPAASWQSTTVTSPASAMTARVIEKHA